LAVVVGLVARQALASTPAAAPDADNASAALVAAQEAAADAVAAQAELPVERPISPNVQYLCVDDNLPAYTTAQPCTNATTITSVQAAVDSAVAGDVILIAAGTYLGGGDPVAPIDVPLPIEGGYAGGSGPNSWLVRGQSNATTLNGGTSRTIVILGAISVTLGNFTIASGGIQNDVGTVNVTLPPTPPDVCTLNLSGGGSTGGDYVMSAFGSICFPSGDQYLEDETTFTGDGVMKIRGGTVWVGLVNTQQVTADRVEITGGTLNGVGTFLVRNVLHWNGGTMDGPFVNDWGYTVISSTATVNLAGTSTTKVLNRRHLLNYGAMIMNGTGTGTLNMGSIAVLNNYGSFTIVNNDSVQYSGVGERPTFHNYGTFTKAAGFGTSKLGTGFLHLISPGSISVFTGTLSLEGGGAGGFEDTITGPMTVAGLSTLNFGGAAGNLHNLGPSSSVTGAGNVTFNGGVTTLAGTYTIGGVTYIMGGTAKFNTNATSASTVINSGTLGGDDSYTTNTLLWTGGTMSAGDTEPGVTNITATGVMTIAGVSSQKTLTGRVLNNLGDTVVNGTGTGAMRMGNAAVFNNAAGATFDIRNNDSVVYIPGSSAAVFINAGTLTKTGGFGTSALGTGAVSFDNVGSVQIMTGTLSLEGGGVDDGSFMVAERSTLRFGGGTHQMHSISSISGPGNVIYAAGAAVVAGAYNITGASTIAGGTAQFDADISTTNVAIVSGVLTGTGTVDITYLNWTGGMMNGPGVTNIGATGVMTIAGVSSTKTLLQRTLNNNGLAVMNGTGTGTVLVGDGADLNNRPGATFDIQNSDSILHSIGTTLAAFSNDGLIKKTGGGVGISTLGSGNLRFNNAGSVEILTSTLSLDGGGVHTGGFDIASVATLRFNNGTHTLQPASSIFGPGNVTMSGGTSNVAGTYDIEGITNFTGGVLNLNSDAASANANLLNGGTLAGTGIFTVTGTLNWNGGIMDGTGITHVPTSGTLNVGGVASNKYLRQRTLNMGGVAYTNGTGTGTLFLGNGAVLRVMAGATFNLANNDHIQAESGLAPVLNNDGTFRKSAGAGISNVGSGAMVFNNNGTVDVLSGVINFGPNFNQQSGMLRLNGGNASIVTNGVFNLLGGALTGAGIVTGTVAASGEVAPGLPVGILTVNGALRLGSSADVNIEIGGSTVGTGYDQIKVLGAATLSGTLNVDVINSYVPNIGDNFPVITYNSRTGVFSAYTGLVLGNGRSFLPQYNAANFTLQVVPGSITPTPIPTSTVPPGTPSPTPTGCVINFVDVQQTDYFYEPVRFLFCRGVISGYTTNPPCDAGTPCFKPYNDTTRGQLTKIVVLAENWAIDTTGGPHFTDVPVNHTFYQYVETAFNHQIINGYADSTFRPSNNVTRGQLTKIVVLAEEWTQICPAQNTFSDVPFDNPFYCFVETAVEHGIINGYADGTFRPNNNATRGQISKIVHLAITQP
jgi:hypothetical protein